ncbi:MAG: sensor histidine kinase [Acidimicrobiales bacterium]
MTLRTRLLLGLLGLVAVGLLASNLVTYRALKSFLYDRLDQQLVDSVRPLSDRLNAVQRGFVRPDRDDVIGIAGETIPVGTWFAIIEADGTTPLPACVACGDPAVNRPAYDADDIAKRSPHSADAVEGSGRFRMIVREQGHDLVVVAMPLKEVEQTLGRLIGIAGLSTLLVLGAVGALARFLVRRGLRPLEDIGRTAGAIAAGDLSRRVEPADTRTEVGQLGLALNSMLGQIEAAFSAQQASEQRLRRFVADASHELRTPLTSIRGYAELFRRGAAERPEDLEKAMRRIEQEARRMGVLVDDLLLLARIDQGRPLERAPVDLARVAADAVDDARAVDPNRPISLDAPPRVIVTGDDLRLRQVVGNLLANARQHTPPGTPVRVRLGFDGKGAVLEVADDGPGLTPDQADHVFERFYRADESRTRAHGGTGLGLAIVAAIAEAHGGGVSVDTGPGRGARFRVEVPLTPVVEAERPPVEATTSPTASSQP